MDNITISNVVKKSALRKVQSKTLDEVAQYLVNSFGPFGSTSIISGGEGTATNYTKDGHDILSHIKFNGAIESTIVDDLVDITRHVVKTVGDGTTSAIEMANAIFKGVCNLENAGYTTREIVDAIEGTVKEICDLVLKNRWECSFDDIDNICYTSTNGNAVLTNLIYNLYRQFGSDVYIDLEVSTSSVENIIKTYEGMVVNAGYTDPIFANSKNNTCEIINPHIYLFEDPVDNAEMIQFFDKIIYTNIYKAYEQGSTIEPTPTVIIAPKISNDMSSYFAAIAKFMMRFDGNAKPPLVIISSYYNQDEMNDIAIMCDIKPIKKYITEESRNSDIANGLAPTIDNVVEFCGSCGKIVADSDSTKFIDPCLRYNEDGSDSVTYTELKKWLETELKKNEDNGGDIKERYALRKRINSLDANLVEFFVGGVSIADRDNDRALLEDAIKNCRSAIANGAGYGANVMGFMASEYVYKERSRKDYELNRADSLGVAVSNVINNAYREVIGMLYKSGGKTDEEIDKCLSETLVKGPLNLRTGEYDHTVVSSIMSDIEILKATTKIITLMATSNQFILPNPQYNVYDV